MDELKGPAGQLIRRNIQETRYEEICGQFGLNKANKELLGKIVSRLNPEFTLEENLELAEEFSKSPDISKVMKTMSVLIKEAANNSGV